MMIEFQAPEYRADTTFRTARYRFEGSLEKGWSIQRNGASHLELGPGYRLLKTASCGVCATDLVRHFLPFPLPQITGHEVIAIDESGDRYAVEINASHQARGLDSDCAYCNAGLSTHCPDRLVLGIHDLPGGFGAFLLAPRNALVRIPDVIPSSTAVLIEPLAAALHAVQTMAPQAGDRIAVLGPRRLGMLVLASLNAYRRQRKLDYHILALSRHDSLLAMAKQFGADTTLNVRQNTERFQQPIAEIVVDTTGSPAGLDLALRLAAREVHLKSTHGQPAAGTLNLTEFVVDELRLAPLKSLDVTRRDIPPRIAWLAKTSPPTEFQKSAQLLRGNASELLQAFEAMEMEGIQRADIAVVENAMQLDAAIRPVPGREVSLVRPRGEILLVSDLARHDSPLLEACLHRDLVLSSSRCGDFRVALELLQDDEVLRGVGEKLITHHLSNADMEAVFALAKSAECIKAVVQIGE